MADLGQEPVGGGRIDLAPHVPPEQPVWRQNRPERLQVRLELISHELGDDVRLAAKLGQLLEGQRPVRSVWQIRPILPEALHGIAAHRLVVQDFRPLPESLEWELARAYWNSSGTDAFAPSEIPFLINNGGRASEDTAATFLALCCEATDLPAA